MAIGNAHGNYPVAPKLAFDVLEQIHNKVDIPLVLHGGSGITDSDFQRAISVSYTHLIGDKIPIQMILTKELSEKHNLWLKSLTDDLEGADTVRRLIEQYGEHKENKLYKSVMNLIVRANQDKFKEVKTMCEALEELMKDEMDAKKAEGKMEGKTESVLDLLLDLGEVPEKLQAEIMGQKNPEILKQWIKYAARAETVEELSLIHI